MKFLVLGCNGMAGHLVSAYMKERGHDVDGFDRTPPRLVQGICGNACDTELLADIIRDGKYDSVINCIGILNSFAEENKKIAAFLNGYLPHFLADITNGTDTQIIHISTDCVFSGDRGGYREDDLRDSKTFYGRSKALGEIEDGKNLTLRTSIVGPDLNSDGIGLLNWFMTRDGDVDGYTGSVWTGQTTLQLARIMEQGAAQKAHGLYNAVPDRAISKYELLCLFNRYLRNESVKIRAVEGVKVDKSLKRTRYDFDFRIPDYEEMISEISVWIKDHRNLYLHYDI